MGGFDLRSEYSSLSPVFVRLKCSDGPSRMNCDVRWFRPTAGLSVLFHPDLDLEMM